MRKHKKRIKELITEEISIVSYNPQWPWMFTQEKQKTYYTTNPHQG
ncbi:MAG: hypothetical protein R6U21_04695 [Thermoplasmatota archaeon]